MIPPRSTVAADQQSERRRPERAWTRREYKGRKKPLHRLLIVSIAAVVLLAGGGIAAPSTVSVSAMQSMLPFFAILAVAAIGQHLVIQQRGLDLSVAGIMSFAAVIVSALPSSEAGVP
jgi:ribose/xylose/arabinose/galactoside ABC-type transport system permease subunit